jgi:hypothetical protein
MAKKGKGMKGESYAVPAKKLETIQNSSAKMGYAQTFGESRKSPSKRGDVVAHGMAKGVSPSKSYDGAGMYMNGAPKYEGAGKHKPGHTDPVSGFGAAYAAARKSGKETFNFQGKPYSTLNKEEATGMMNFGNTNISNFRGGDQSKNAGDSKDYEFAKYMGYTNKQISKNVQNVIDSQKKGAAALGKPMTDYENPFKGS